VLECALASSNLKGRVERGGNDVRDEGLVFGLEYGQHVHLYHGAPSHFAVHTTLLPREACFSFNLPRGEHVFHSEGSATSIHYKSLAHKVHPATGIVEYDELQREVSEVRPAMIVCGVSAHSAPLDFGRMRVIADEVGAVLMADLPDMSVCFTTYCWSSLFVHCDLVSMRQPHQESTVGIVIFKCGALPSEVQVLFDTPLFPGAQGGAFLQSTVLAENMDGCVFWDIRPSHVAAPPAKLNQPWRSDTEHSSTATFLERCCSVARDVQHKGGPKTPRGVEALQRHLAAGTTHTPSPLARDLDAIVQTVRSAVLQEAEKRMSEEASRLIGRGSHLFGQIQARHKEALEKLTQEVVACTVRQRALENENNRLREEIRSLTPNPLSDRPSPPSLPSSVQKPGCPTSSKGVSRKSATSFPFSEVPPFPFLPSVSTIPTPPPLSAEALTAEGTSRGPLSLERCLSSPGSSKTSTSEVGGPSKEGSSFTFTLRKADGAELGLNLSHREDDGVLCVEGVRSGGAIEAWNKQCADSAASGKALVKGDHIVSVNGVTDAVKMLDECRCKLLLKFTVMRRPASSSLPPGGDTPPSPKAKSGLRADAIEFVPGIQRSPFR
jgi:hypothetical protein